MDFNYDDIRCTYANIPTKDNTLTIDDLLRCIELIGDNPIEKFMRDNGFNPDHDKIVFPLGFKPQFEKVYPYGFPRYMEFSPIIDDNDNILLVRCDAILSPLSLPFDWDCLDKMPPTPEPDHDYIGYRGATEDDNKDKVL